MTTLNDVLAIRDRIHTFEKECDEAEYTDTGEAWVLLNDTVRELNELASKDSAYINTNRRCTRAR